MKSKVATKISSSLKGMVSCTVAGAVLGFSAAEVATTHEGYERATLAPVEVEVPKSHFFLSKEEFSVQYDGRLKQPAYVYETVFAEQLAGDVDRGKYEFQEDDKIPTKVRAGKSDYKGSGYDRGHLSPASNHKSSNVAMGESFLYSNISPQKPKFNRGYWKKLERRVQELALQYGKVVAVTGPLFLAEKGADGRRYVTYEVIGKNEVAAPTHFFKVINTPAFKKAYILRNEFIDPTIDLEEFAVPIEKVERASGIVFS